MRTTPTIAICTTTLPPRASFNTWVDYHLQHVDRIFLFIDGSMDAGTRNISVPPRMSVFANEDSGIEMRSPNDTMMMQSKNVEIALDLCRRENIDWLFHIDSDELIWSRSTELKTYLGQLDNDISQVSFVNHEAAQCLEDVENCFTELHIFKRNGAAYLLPENDPRRSCFFHAYGNGKSAVKVDRCNSPNGVHQFWTTGGRTYQESGSPCILHYPNPSYRDWLKKWKRHGSFSNFWWEDPTQPITLSFLTGSRDAYMRAESLGDWKIAEDYFKASIFSKEELEQLIGIGACFSEKVIKKND